MTELETLFLFYFEREQGDSFFCNQKCFPNLKQFQVFGYGEETGSEWNKAGHIWKNVENCQFSFSINISQVCLPLLDHEGYLQNLRTLSISYFRFFDKSETPRQIDLPKLESLSIGLQCYLPLESITKRTTDSLKSISFKFEAEVERNYFKNLFLRSPNVEEIEVYIDRDMVYSINLNFLYEPKQPPLKSVFVSKEQIPALHNADENSHIEWNNWNDPRHKSFVENLESFTFSTNDNEIDYDSTLGGTKKNFKRLRELRLFGCWTAWGDEATSISFTGNNTFSFADSLYSLSLDCVTNLTDFLFQKNNFKNLRELSISECNKEIMTGKNWNPMERIRRLDIPHYESIMKTMKFPNLEVLSLSDGTFANLSEWRLETTQALKSLSFYPKSDLKKETFDLDGVSDEKRFAKLESLSITMIMCELNDELKEDSDNHSMRLNKKGEWKGFKNLTRLILQECSFKDDFLRGEWTKNLRHLQISESSLFQGIGWEPMPKLVYLKVNRCKDFQHEKFMQDPPFEKNKVLAIMERNE